MKNNCLKCTKEFYVKPNVFKKGYGKFCSKDCVLIYKKENSSDIMKKFICSYCNIEFLRYKKNFSKSGFYFCCRKHKDLAQRIGGIKEIQPSHYKDGSFNYRDIAFRNFDKKCNKCGYYEYPAILVVHHKDRDRSNNNLSNLEILCPNCHEIEHYRSFDGRYSRLQSRRSPN